MVQEQKKRKKILVVEDDPLNMQLVVDLLELNGFVVLQAWDGEVALEILKGDIPDLIMLDIGLPGMDGYELFKRVRSDVRLAAVKIMALTALVAREDKEKVFGMGFDAYFPKPFEIKKLLATVQELLSWNGTVS